MRHDARRLLVRWQALIILLLVPVAAADLDVLSVALLAPEEGALLSQDPDFDFSPSLFIDDTIASCALYGNFSSPWAEEDSVASPANATLATFSVIGLAEGAYLWNVQCSLENGSFSFNATNRSFTFDATTPSVAFLDPTPAHEAVLRATNATIAVEALDSLPVACTLFWDNGTAGNYSMPWNGTACSLTAYAVDAIVSYSVSANDSAGNEDSLAQTATFDTAPPALSVSAASVVQGFTTAVSCSVSDLTSVATSLTVTKPSGFPVSLSCGAEFTATDEVGTHQLALAATDAAGNSAAATGSFEVTGPGGGGSPSPAPSSGGGGGGGSSPPPAPTLPSAFILLGDLAPRSRVEVPVNGTVVTAVSVSVLEGVSGATLLVEELPALRLDGRELYRAFSVASDIGDRLGTLSFRVSVPQEWLREHGLRSQDIVILRKTPYRWQRLPLRILGAGEFEATSPAFSTFAIAGSSPSAADLLPDLATRLPLHGSLTYDAIKQLGKGFSAPSELPDAIKQLAQLLPIARPIAYSNLFAAIAVVIAAAALFVDLRRSRRSRAKRRRARA